MHIIDLHCDTLSAIADHQPSTRLIRNDLHVDLEKLQSSNYMMQVFACFLHKQSLDEKGISYTHRLQQMMNVYQLELKDNADILHPVLNYKDIELAASQNKIASMLAVEGSCFVEGDMDRIQWAYDQGVRLMTLTWNFENCFGYPNVKDGVKNLNPDIMNRGLKPFGIDALAEMNRLGIAIDVSHLSDGGFYDVAKYSQKPFLASHSNARSMTAVTRNLTDDMLRVLADKGGITGINFCAPFLGPDNVSRVSDMVRHIQHIRNAGGIEILALGSDFDGIGSTLEITDASKMGMLIKALDQVGFTTTEIEAIAYRNAIRFFQSVL